MLSTKIHTRSPRKTIVPTTSVQLAVPKDLQRGVDQEDPRQDDPDRAKPSPWDSRGEKSAAVVAPTNAASTKKGHAGGSDADVVKKMSVAVCLLTDVDCIDALEVLAE